MKKLYWLRNIRPCKIDISLLKDSAGQPLKFTQKGTSFARRCVTEEVRRHALVEMYISRNMLEDEADVPDKPLAAPTPDKPVAPPKPNAPPVEKPAPAPEPAPAPAEPKEPVVTEPTPEPDKSEPVSESTEAEKAEEPKEEEVAAAKPRRRRRKS